MRHLADPGGVGPDNVVSAGQHFSAASAVSQTTARWISSAETLPDDCAAAARQRGRWIRARRARVGVPAAAAFAPHDVALPSKRAEGEVNFTRRCTLGVKPEFAFDVCWDVYRNAREVLESKRSACALNWKDASPYLWRPDIRARLNEWVADFALAGQAALDSPDHSSRMVMFRLFYLGLAPYDKARHFLGLSELTWSKWNDEVRKRCGKELVRRGMFPPRKYFGSSA
jgi:hypothetical protein